MALLNKALTRASNPEQIEQQLKAQIQEVVRAYRHSWDIYSELLQNSVDAINRRFRILNDPEFYLYETYRQYPFSVEPDEAYYGRIHIFVSLVDKTIEIRDNGVGIAEEKIEDFLLPKGGDKIVAQEYGFKGYGLTYAAFISEKFMLQSRPFFVKDAVPCYLNLNGLFGWLSDDSGTVAFPDGPVADTMHSKDSMNDWNTVIRLQLADDYTMHFPAVSSVENAIRLADTGWITYQDEEKEKRKPEGFEFILRTRTALGNTRPLFNKSPVVPIRVTLSIEVSDDELIENIEIPYSYYHPRFHPEIAVDSYDFADYYENRYKRTSMPNDFRGLYHALSEVSIGTRRPLSCDVALAAIATNRLSNIEGALELSDIEAGDVGVTYGIHLAIDGMPTGLRIDDWDMRSNTLQRYYAVVDADLDVSNQLDPGRKGISDYYARLISQKVLDLISSTKVADSDSFASFSSTHLNHGRGRGVDEDIPSPDFSTRIEQAARWQQSDKERESDLLERLQSISSLRHLPSRDEQEVIALFYELQSLRIIKGYSTVYISSKAPYDAAFEYEIQCTSDNVYPEDPLGLGRVIVDNLRSRGMDRWTHRRLYPQISFYPELCVDFKRNLGGFLDEVNRPRGSRKDPGTIDLLIFWDLQVPSSIPSELYTIDPLIDNRRKYHSTTHRLGLRGHFSTDIECISLKDVIAKIVPDYFNKFS